MRRDAQGADRNVDKRGASAGGGMVHALPVFRGWTVDMRLREFRMMSPEEGMVFVPFASEDGQELLAAYLHSLG